MVGNKNKKRKPLVADYSQVLKGVGDEGKGTPAGEKEINKGKEG